MWIHLVFNARWEDSLIIIGNNQVLLKRGQIAVSTRELMKQWGCCCDMATAFLRALEFSGMITRENFPKYSIISIVNFDTYQPKNADQFQLLSDTENPTTAVRKTVQYKRNKEKEKINIIIDNGFSAEKENDFYEKIKDNSNTISSLCVVFNEKPQKIKDELFVFLNDITLRKSPHTDADAFVKHFKHWYEKKQKAGGAAQPKLKDEPISQQQSARRGTEISNKPNKDYKNDAF
jgi:hypothetical protein